MVASLSTSISPSRRFRRMPQCPWSVYSSTQTSVMTTRSGAALFILATGKFLLGEEILDIERLRDLLEREYLMTVLPEGQGVYVPEVTSFQATNVMNAVSEEEFLKETADIVRELNGQPTTLDRCRDAWNAYSNDNSYENLQALKAPYDSVPEHNRVWLGDFDSKDVLIRQTLYGDQSG